MYKNFKNIVVFKKILWGSLSALLFLALYLGGHTTFAQNEESLYFPETGHFVTGEFLIAYRRVPDSSNLFGNPITDAFSKPGRDGIYQYFKKALFVLDPKAPPELRVQVAPLGKMLYSPGTAPSHSPNSSGCQDFLDSGNPYQVCYAFLDFFNKYGGVLQFGYPVSNFESREGLIVQYFERTRFEWHPELPAGQLVTLTNLGEDFFKVIGEEPQLLLPNIDDNIPQPVIQLNVRAFAGHAVMPLRGEQTLYVVVQDQNLRPVPNAQVTILSQLPSGKQIFIDMPLTDENGITSVSFLVNAQTQGIAEVLVSAQYGDFFEQTFTSFRIWW